MAALASSRARDLAVGAGLSVAFLAVYAATMCRTVFWYDSAEFATAAYVLGIPHPPGYPLYTLVGHVFTWLPMEPAAAVNLMSAVFGAVSVGLLYAVLRTIDVSRVGAGFGAAVLGAGHLFWSNAVVAEVYTPGIAALLAVVLLLLRGLASDRALPIVVGAGLAGLGLGLHMSLATCGAGFALLAASLGLRIDSVRGMRQIASRAQLRRRAAVAAGCLGAAALGSCIFLYLPWRSSMDPPLDFGNVEDWDRFVWAITGGNYKHLFGVEQTFAERALHIAGSLASQLTWLGLALALGGVGALVRRRPLVAAALMLMAIGNVWFFFDYRVHDLEVFFLPTTAVLAALAGVGADAALRALPRFQRLASGALCAVPAFMVLANYHAVDMSGFREAEAYGDELVELLPEHAVIVTFTSPPEWQHSAVFQYYQLVRGERRDVQIVTTPSASWLARLIGSGRAVYLYHPVPHVAHGSFFVDPEGPLYRVRLRPRDRMPP